jgi:phosphoribosylamine-glycine ligase
MINQQTNSTSNSNINSNKIVVVVDPRSTRYNVALEIYRREYQVIVLWSSNMKEEMRASNSSEVFGNINYLAEVEENETLEDTRNTIERIAANNNYLIIAVLSGAENGVPLADSLSEFMGLLSNGNLLDGPDRRDKYVQQELTRQAGLRSVRQVIGSSFSSEVGSFLKTESYPLVIKPNAGQGSDGVKLCYTFQAAKDHFNFLLGHESQYDKNKCTSILCQEFLQGAE